MFGTNQLFVVVLEIGRGRSEELQNWLMEKREPSLVPEWLRSAGNGSSVGSKNHILSSSARSGMLHPILFLLNILVSFPHHCN